MHYYMRIHEIHVHEIPDSLPQQGGRSVEAPTSSDHLLQSVFLIRIRPGQGILDEEEGMGFSCPNLNYKYTPISFLPDKT